MKLVLKQPEKCPICHQPFNPPKPPRKCPECGAETNGDIHKTPAGKDCDMVLGRRGWRQLGVYDG